MATLPVFRKAVKHEARGRVALIGPAGSGKSYTALQLARLLAGPQGKIAAIDTEHGSLSKYADLVDFDVLELDSFTADNFLAALHAAEEAGYAVFCCDSLSHFWMGKDGALEFVDERKKRVRDQMEGWKDWRPHERAMIEAMIASPLHIIVTMRTKNEYRDEQYTDRDGKTRTKRVKVGLAPVQRDGLEYEFDLVGYMSDENDMIVDKSRCPALSGRAMAKPDAKALTPFRDWLAGAPKPAAPTPRPVIVPPAQPVAIPTAAAGIPDAVVEIWRRMSSRKGIISECDNLRQQLIAAEGPEAGESTYLTILRRHGVESPEQFARYEQARNCARALWQEIHEARILMAGPQPVADLIDSIPEVE